VKNQEKAYQIQQYLYITMGVNVLLAATVALNVFAIIVLDAIRNSRSK
jgi:hypothetical protein